MTAIADHPPAPLPTREPVHARIAASIRRWPTLADLQRQPRDNFLLLRLVAAALVIYGHAPAISGGGPVDLFIWLGWDIYSGLLGVATFFFVSGYLVTGSWLRRRNLVAFGWARLLRIVPALLLCLVVCAFAIGALVTTHAASDYYADPETLRYVTQNAKLRYGMAWTLPGVFTDNPMPTVNGSLWTLPIELRLYVWVAVIGALGIAQRRWLFNIVAIGLLAVGSVDIAHIPLLRAAPETDRLAGLFLLGALCQVNRDRIRVHGGIAVAIAALAWLVRDTPLYPWLFALALGATVFWLAYRTRWTGYNRFGDYSYGLYLWGFPVQQLVHSAWPSLGALGNAAVSLPLALACGVLSWHAIEQPALRLRDAPVWLWRRWRPFNRRGDG